jgi:hypothetical protein
VRKTFRFDFSQAGLWLLLAMFDPASCIGPQGRFQQRCLQGHEI